MVIKETKIKEQKKKLLTMAASDNNSMPECPVCMERLTAGLKIALPSLVIIRYGSQEPAVLLVLVMTPAETPEKTLPVSTAAKHRSRHVSRPRKLLGR